MKATAYSEFHGDQMRVSFTGLEIGENIRKLLGPRSNYCMDYSNNNSHVCGCGYPIGRTRWELPEGYLLRTDPEECGADGGEYGHGYIKINIVKVA